jgi:hypothetical protein
VRSARVINGSLQKVDFCKKTIGALKGAVVLKDGPSRNRTLAVVADRRELVQPTCRSS